MATPPLPPVEPRPEYRTGAARAPSQAPPADGPPPEEEAPPGFPPAAAQAPPVGYRPSAGVPRAWSGRSSVIEVDKDVAGMARLSEAIKQLRTQDETYVSIFRVEPAYHPITRKPIRGYKARFPVSEFRGPEDLMEKIEREYGGYKWDLRFSVPDGKDSGSLRYYKSIRMEIDREPIVDSTQKIGERPIMAGPPPPPDVNAELVRGTFEMMNQQIVAGRQQQQPTNDGGLGLAKELLAAQAAAVPAASAGFKEALRASERRADDARKEIADMRTTMMSAQSNAPEAMKAVTESTTMQVAQAHKEAATQIERIRNDHERAIKAEQERAERDRSFALERHKTEVDRLQDQINRVTDRLAESERKATDERTRLTQEHQTEIRHLRTSQKDAADTGAGRLDDERRSVEKVRGLMEERLKVELAGLRSTHQAQVTGLEERLKLAEERQRESDRRWEDKTRDVEKQRDGLMSQLMDEKTRRPDPLSNVSETVGMIAGLAGKMGYIRDGGSPSPRTELADTLLAVKEAGIVDAAKGIGQQIVGAMKRAPAPPPAPPPQVIALPRHPVTGQAILPPAPGAAPMPAVAPRGTPAATAPQAAPAPPPAPSPVYQAAEAPAQAPQQQAAAQPAAQPTQDAVEADVLGMVVPALGQEFESGRPVADVAKDTINILPLGTVRQYLDGGTAAFMAKVEGISPESPLLSARGETFLRDLFAALRDLIK